MSAEIKGLVRGPSGDIVPATVTLKPIPDPMRGSEGSVVTGGVVAANKAPKVYKAHPAPRVTPVH